VRVGSIRGRSGQSHVLGGPTGPDRRLRVRRPGREEPWLGPNRLSLARRETGTRPSIPRIDHRTLGVRSNVRGDSLYGSSTADAFAGVISEASKPGHRVGAPLRFDLLAARASIFSNHESVITKLRFLPLSVPRRTAGHRSDRRSVSMRRLPFPRAVRRWPTDGRLPAGDRPRRGSVTDRRPIADERPAKAKRTGWTGRTGPGYTPPEVSVRIRLGSEIAASPNARTTSRKSSAFSSRSFTRSPVTSCGRVRRGTPPPT